MIDVLVPTYGRPDKLAALTANIAGATTVDHRIVYIHELDDHPTAETVAALMADWPTVRRAVNEHARSYAGAVQTGYELSHSPLLFCAADDLMFHPGWAAYALDELTGSVRVVGTNDLCNPYVSRGIHATHYLVDRRYLDEQGGVIDAGPGSFLNLAYDHQFTDSEFIGTARHRGVFAPCLAAVVEHMHWSTGKSEADDTTARTMRRYSDDEVLFRSRRPLWGCLDCHQDDPT